MNREGRERIGLIDNLRIKCGIENARDLVDGSGARSKAVDAASPVTP
jgi:hypothetical protein